MITGRDNWEYVLFKGGNERRMFSIPGVDTAEVKFGSSPFVDNEGILSISEVETAVTNNCVGIGVPDNQGLI
jgi:hypothetical protein